MTRGDRAEELIMNLRQFAGARQREGRALVFSIDGAPVSVDKGPRVIFNPSECVGSLLCSLPLGEKRYNQCAFSLRNRPEPRCIELITH